MTNHIWPNFKSYLSVLTLLLVAIFLVANVHAANEAVIGTSGIPSDGIFRKAIEANLLESNPTISITFHLIEESKLHSTSIILFADDLQKENGEGTIERRLINITREGGFDASKPFMFNAKDVVEITITIDTKNVKAGVYKGLVTIHSENATNKQIPIKLEISQTPLIALGLNFIGAFIGIVFAILGIPLSRMNARKLERKTTFRHELTEMWENKAQEIIENIRPIAVFLAVLIILGLLTFTAYYPKIVAFGANPLFDYATALLFGFTQVGASKITADILKN